MTAIPNDAVKAKYFDGKSTHASMGLFFIKESNVYFVSAPEANAPSDQEFINPALDAQVNNGFELCWPVADLELPEDLGQKAALLSLPGWASIEIEVYSDWKYWSDKHQLNRGFQKYQLKSSFAFTAVFLIALFGVLVWKWGIPWAAEKSLVLIPHEIDQQFGEKALEYIDETFMQETNLTSEEQDEIATAFEEYLALVEPNLSPEYDLQFRSSSIGPNAFALPGGIIIMTDEIVDLLENDKKALFGVFAHELGHVKNRDSMKSLVQLSATGILMNLWIGDFSTTLASIPVIIEQASYSREIERTADESAAKILTQANISPLVMVKLFDSFEELAKERKDRFKLEIESNPSSSASKKASDAASEEDSGFTAKLDYVFNQDKTLGIDFSSHPANEERIKFFKDAAANCSSCQS